MRPFSFLIDRSAAKAASLFPKHRVFTLEALRIPEDAGDDEIVRQAWRHACIIVTANGDDFISAIHRFQKKQMRKECHELNGLIILPNEFEVQKQIVKQSGKKLRFGLRQIGWPDVSNDNLCVRLKKSGAPDVKRSPRCFYCQKMEAR